VILGLAIALGAGAARAQSGPGGMREAPGAPTGERPNVLRQVTFDQKLDAQVPGDLLFRDDAGRAVLLKEYFGTRPLVLALVYYECPSRA
jgi:protein SCO1/2